MMEFLQNKIFKIVSQAAKEQGVRAFVIGGYVRDCYLGRPCKDIDIVVEGSGIELAELVAKRVGSKLSVFKNFGTAMLRFRENKKSEDWIEIEFVGARKESYRRESRKPIVEDGTLEEDQQRRDFTINALAFSLQEEDYGALVDPFNGMEDMRNGLIRTPLDPDTYLFLISPRLSNPADMELLRCDYAHRGLWNDRFPENSLPAFDLAARNGYGIELDIQLSKDKRNISNC